MKKRKGKLPLCYFDQGQMVEMLRWYPSTFSSNLVGIYFYFLNDCLWKVLAASTQLGFVAYKFGK